MKAKKISIQQRIIALVLLNLLGMGCGKLLEASPPSTQLARTNVFNNDASAIAAMAGVYSEMSQTGYASGNTNSLTYLCGFSSDELQSYSFNTELNDFYNYSLNSKNSLVQNLWAGEYKTIYECNSIMESLGNLNALSHSRQEVYGEALFLRSFVYYHLINLFGDVPLVMTSDYNQNKTISRSQVKDIYNQIISDLLKAYPLLFDDYSSFNGDRGRPIKAAASSLLTKCYLATSQFDLAEKYSSEVISNVQQFNLEDSLNDAFLNSSTEAIWQLHPVSADYTNEAASFIIFGYPSGAVLSKTLLEKFSPNDKRKSHWIGVSVVGDSSYFFPYKYKKTAGSTGPLESSIVFRLADIILSRAESLVMEGGAQNYSKACVDINTIRKRAGLGLFSSQSKDSILIEIQTQRQLELFCEWGFRWFDLKRYVSPNNPSQSFVDYYLSKVKPGLWKAYAALYPIPQVQIDNDVNMSDGQNPGY